MKKISLIDACSDLGVHVDGAKFGPEAITKNLNTYISNPNIEGVHVIYSQNVKKELEKENKKKNLAPVNEFNTRLYNLVYEILKNENFPVTIGGDHVIAIASALASIKKHQNLGIIWVDAHGDFNTFNSTSSGNLHGLPLAVIANYEKKLLADFHNGNFYNPKNTVIVGGRDIDPWEMPNIKDAGVTVFSTEDIHKYGAEEILNKAFEIASNGTNGVHISYDLDVIDPKMAPGVSIPAVDGINLDEAYEIANIIRTYIENDIVKSLDLVELNPLRDIDNVTEKIAKNILKMILN